MTRTELRELLQDANSSNHLNPRNLRKFLDEIIKHVTDRSEIDSLQREITDFKLSQSIRNRDVAERLMIRQSLPHRKILGIDSFHFRKGSDNVNQDSRKGPKDRRSCEGRQNRKVYDNSLKLIRSVRSIQQTETPLEDRRK